MKVTAKINSVVAGTLFVGMAAATFAMLRGTQVQAEYASLLTHEVAQVEGARQLQVMFKKQVQAWKDILLRGSDPASLEKYTGEFLSLDKKVDEAASALRSSTDNGAVRKKLSEFADAHQLLGEKYRAGLDVFRESKGKDFAAVDKMVKGQDRAPTDLIDSVVASLQESSAAAQARTVALAAATRHTTIAVILISSGLALFVATTLSRRITRALHVVLARAELIAQGDLTGSEIAILTKDEVGDLSAAMNTMQRKLRDIIASVAKNAQHVASASEELSATSRQISANSEETSTQASVVSQAAKQVNQNLQSVSTGAEEMTSTIESISSNAHDAATVASQAVQTAHAADVTVAKLGESSAEIGAVIKVITAIAQQTNLLALNATIEAARAGESGKGFAVVANEVKELAKQTATATEDISRKINTIQADTKEAVGAIGSISGVIDKVNEISATIATAVEEQSATTSEMTRNVADAARGSAEITQNIEGVAQAAHGTSNSAHESQKAANDLADMAAQLRGLVTQFKVTAEGPELATLMHSGEGVAASAGR